MQITITIADKELLRAIDLELRDNLYEAFSPDVLDAAKVPKITALTAEIFADPKFHAKLTKNINSEVKFRIDDFFGSVVSDTPIPQLDRLVKQCDIAWREIDKEEESEMVRSARRVLTKAGYKIIKA